MRIERTQRRSLSSDQEGLSTVEYIIILVLIAVLAITVWRQVGQAVETNVRDSTADVQGLRGGS